MKKIIILTLLVIAINQTDAQKITSIEAEGNLKSSNPLSCVDLSQVSNTYNPADIYNGIRECIKLKNYQNAAKLFALAGVYGRYDSYRVKDKSAHQAINVLKQNMLSDIEENERDSLIENVRNELKSDSEKLRALCRAIRKIGAPSYYPNYMIQHGIQAFTGKNSNALIENFDSENSWNLSLKEYLHCVE